MTTATPLQGSPASHTITLASLASDTNLVAGREGTAINNGSGGEDAIDAMVGGFVTTGTSPTASRQIEIWAYGSYDGTSYGGGCSGTDGNRTPEGSQKSQLKLLTVIPTTNASNQKYTWGPYSVAEAFGGLMPAKWGVFVVHNTGVNLNSTGGNHEVKHNPVKYESA